MSITITNNGKIHSTVKFSGTGTVIVHPGAQIREYSVIEMNNGRLELMAGAILGFFTMVQCTGEMVIGEQTMIGPHCTLLASHHVMSADMGVQRALVRSTLNIGYNVWSGANVVFNDGITVGHDSVIAANSFVNTDVPASTVFGGTPAKLIKGKYT
jgi:acetyltransferase-like isoleucine patch superfamily enzyme